MGSGGGIVVSGNEGGRGCCRCGEISSWKELMIRKVYCGC